MRKRSRDCRVKLEESWGDDGEECWKGWRRMWGVIDLAALLGHQLTCYMDGIEDS